MSQPRAFVSRMMHPDAIALIGEGTDMEVWPDDPPPSPEQLRAKLADAEGALINIMDRVDAPLLDAAPKLRVISQLAAGLDNVDITECTRRGILLGSTPGILSKAVADHGFALLLSAARRVAESDKWVRGNNWELAFHPNYWLGSEVQGSALGIVGLGQIGLEMARRAQGFDMRVIYHSRNRRPEAEAAICAQAGRADALAYAPLDELLSQSDYVSLHCPLTPETRHLINANALRKMKPTAILVNISRGPVVDTDALCQALREGWIGGAGLDVVDPEPIPDDHPLLFMDNVTITPHIGSASVLSRRAMSIMAAQNLVNGLNGQRLVHCANPELYQRLGI